MTDGYGRKIEYLRMSVTDACNLRCVYCMPPDGMAECPCHSAMSADEFVEIAHAAAELGMKKLRITAVSRWCGVILCLSCEHSARYRA